MPQIGQDDQGVVRFTVPSLAKGAWTHLSPLSCPEGYTPTITNFDLPGGIPTTMYGDNDFIATAWPAAWSTATLLCHRRIAGSSPVIIMAGIGGYVGYWTGAAWVTLRVGLSTGGLQWSWVQYGTDLFITNTSDGIYRYDGNSLVPVGAKPICQMETDENALWAGDTGASTAIFQEGLQSRYITTGAHAAAAVNAVFTPAAAIDLQTGRLSAINYAVNSVGTDYYHFKLRVTDISLLDTTNSRVLFTTSGGNTLNFPASAWRTDRVGTVLNVATAADNTWIDIYLLASTGTQTGAYNPAIVTTITFSFDSTGASVDAFIDDCYVIYATTMPAVAYLAEWKNMLFGGYTTANPDYWYFSKVSAPDQYSGTAYNPIKAHGESITGLANFYNQLVIGADHSVHTLSISTIGSTYPAYLFDYQQVTDEAGMSSHFSVVKGKNRLWWWYQRQIITYNGTGVSKESFPVDETLATVDESVMPRINGAPFRRLNQLWWTFPYTGGQGAMTAIRYDQVMGAWLPNSGLDTGLLLQTYQSGTELLLTVNNSTRKVKKQADTTSLSFSGTAIEATICLPPMTVDAALIWLDSYVKYLSNTGTVTVAYRVVDHYRELAAAGYTTSEAVNQAVAGELGKMRIGSNGTICQIRLTTSGVRAQIQPPILVTANPLSPGQRFV